MKPTWKFFPVIGKQPALEGDWRKHSTSDPAQLDAWRRAGYGLALDCEASGVFVVDVDPGGLRPDNLPDTYIKTTPRGGFHMVYEGVGATSVSKLADHVDTRGVGGYIVFEGPGYSQGVGEVAAAPAWALAAVEARREGKAAAAGVELDQPHNVDRAVRWLEGRAPLIQGQGADAGTYYAAQVVLDFGLSPERAIDIMTDHLKIMPRDERFPAFLERKVTNAHEYRQNDVGAWALPAHGERFAGATFDRGAVGRKLGRFHPFSVEEQDEMAPPLMLVPDFLPADAITMLFGLKGTYKSFLALDFALTYAAGVPGWGLEGGDGRTVVYVAGEGPSSVARKRRPAWEAERGVDWDYPFFLVKTMPAHDNVKEFVAELKEAGVRPSLVVIDTLARFMFGLNENDVRDVHVAIEALEYVRDSFGCAVLVVHHASSKTTTEGPRGSSAIAGAVDTLHEVKGHREARCVEVSNLYQKDGEERGEPWCFEGQTKHGSLVFRPISKAQLKELTTKDDGLGFKRVQAVLVGLKAIGREHAVTTRMLSTTLLSSSEEQSPDGATLERLAALDAKLKAAARDRLAPLCEKGPRELLWFIA